MVLWGKTIENSGIYVHKLWYYLKKYCKTTIHVQNLQYYVENTVKRWYMSKNYGIDLRTSTVRSMIKKGIVLSLKSSVKQ